MLRETVLNRVIELISEQYVFADKARELVERMQRNTSEYATAKTDHQFAALISRDMAAVTHDVHLTLNVRVKGDQWWELPPVAETKFIQGGVAIIQINRFPSTNSAKGEDMIREMDHAFLMAARASAIILDVRGNEGGDGSSVALATTYLLPPKPHLLAVYRYRLDMAPRQSWTWEKLPHEVNGPFRPLADKPACVLVSKKTFSAAEEFAYTLQQMKRAIVIGEQTRGGAHPSKRQIIDGTFVLSIPIAETISPITKSNWEGVGVTPDKICLRRDALKIAKEYLYSLSPVAVQKALVRKRREAVL
ncbi:MAG TPA: S41 family peptidase [Candidatus Kapabacteria bacterium]|nr:S41 family peptidase [Candidatus Kapabacteria bacterium]